MIKILIVDDEKPICDLIDLNLSAAGYFCKSVQDGMKAIECIEREKFDLILLDIIDRKSTRLNSSHSGESRMPSSA